MYKGNTRLLYDIMQYTEKRISGLLPFDFKEAFDSESWKFIKSWISSMLANLSENGFQHIFFFYKKCIFCIHTLLIFL